MPTETSLSRPAAWHPVAGDDRQLHLFLQDGPQWWETGFCGAGPAVGRNDTDRNLARCATCAALHETREEPGTTDDG